VIGNVVGIGIGMILYNLSGGDSIHVLTWRFFHPIIVCNVIISYILILPLLVLFRKVSSTFDIRLGGSLLYLLIAIVLLLNVVLSYSDSRAIHTTFAELLSEEELQRLAAEAALANFRHGGSLGIVAILVGVGMAFVLIQYLLRPIRMLMQAARELKEGRLDQIRLGDLTHKRDELGQLAQVFDEAVARVREREAQLKHVIEKLRLEINTEQETQQVREITETEYFQSLRERSHALRARKADRPHEKTPHQSGSESTD
jgi:HAMP domain-containing protein